jgi:hypothetical protein
MTDVRMLQAPGDPGDAGLLVVIALVLLAGLALAHLRLLRAIARAGRRPVESGTAGRSVPPPEAAPPAADDRPSTASRDEIPA